jgi:hypothetical protein
LTAFSLTGPGPLGEDVTRRPARARTPAPSRRSPVVIILVVLVFGPFRDRYGIGAAEPAVKIDIGAAARTKRSKAFDLRFAADRAGSGLFAGGHDGNVV